MRLLKMLLVLLVCAAGPAVAGPFEDELKARGEAAKAIKDGDYATALKIYRPLAENGNTNAMFWLAKVYHGGSHSVPKDMDEAVRWYTKVAEQGDEVVQMSLALMYYTGTDLKQDYSKAAIWYGKAADRGSLEAQSMLGLMYAWGQGVPQDYVLAHKWSNLAASTAVPGKEREDAVDQRDSVAKKMTPAQIAEAQKLAREWKPKTGR